MKIADMLHAIFRRRMKKFVPVFDPVKITPRQAHIAIRCRKHSIFTESDSVQQFGKLRETKRRARGCRCAACHDRNRSRRVRTASQCKKVRREPGIGIVAENNNGIGHVNLSGCGR